MFEFLSGRELVISLISLAIAGVVMTSMYYDRLIHRGIYQMKKKFEERTVPLGEFLLLSLAHSILLVLAIAWKQDGWEFALVVWIIIGCVLLHWSLWAFGIWLLIMGINLLGILYIYKKLR